MTRDEAQRRRKATDPAKMSDEALVEARDRLNVEIERRKYEARQRLRALGDEPAFQNCTFENCTFEGFRNPDEGQPIDLRPSDEAIAEVESLRDAAVTITARPHAGDSSTNDISSLGNGAVASAARLESSGGEPEPDPLEIPAFLRRAQA